VTSVVVDTNVLLSFLLDRDPDQQRRAAELLEAASARSLVLVLHQQVLTELVYVLLNVYHQSRGATAEIVSDLLALPGVQTLDSLEWGQVLRMWPEPLHDFADAALAACRSGGHDAVATFDVTFARALQELGLRSYWDDVLRIRETDEENQY
jgi:predicted nucleic acid-binding protein